MIRLIDVSKYFVMPFGRHYVFRNVNLELPLDRNVGIIGPNGAGKSTFLRLLAGADHPSSGTIVKSGRISPPMGLTPVLQKSLSALENVRFAGRIYGMQKPEIDRMVDYVRDLAKIGYYFEMPVETYSAGMRQKVAFGINMSMKFDYYLFDEISAGGDREFRKMAKAMVAERLRTSRFVMTSHDTSELLELCDSGIVIRDGTLTYFDDIREAAIFYGDEVESTGKKTPRRKRKAEKAADAGEGNLPEEGRAATSKDGGRKKRRRKSTRRAKSKKVAADQTALGAETKPEAAADPALVATSENGAAEPKPRKRRGKTTRTRVKPKQASSRKARETVRAVRRTRPSKADREASVSAPLPGAEQQAGRSRGT